MRTDRMERGFWAFALCRAPNGWALNFGSLIVIFGEFTEATEASKIANAYYHVYSMLQRLPGDVERDAVVWDGVRAALYGAGVTTVAHPLDEGDADADT